MPATTLLSKANLFLGLVISYFSRFLVALIEYFLLYCIFAFYTNLYVKDKSSMSQVYKIANKMGIRNADIDTIIDTRTKNDMLQILHVEEHPIHRFIDKLQSGRCRTLKTRAVLGNNSFLKHFIHYVNSILAGRQLSFKFFSILFLWAAQPILFSLYFTCDLKLNSNSTKWYA